MALNEAPTTPTTPEPTPTSPATEPPEPALAGNEEVRDDEFAFLGTGKKDDVPATITPAPSLTPSSPAEVMAAAGAPQQTGQPLTASAPAPAAAATPVPAAPAPAAPTPQAAPAAAPRTPEQVASDYQAHRQQSIEKLAAQTFQLDQATVDALQTEPEKVIPVLMAQATMAAMEATTVAFANMLPDAILRVTKQQREFEQNETEFFTAWPALKDPKYAEQLARAGGLYRQLNPTAPKEQFIQDVGAAVAAALGVQAQAVQPGIVPTAPRPLPHAPIATSAPRSGPVPVAQENRFALLIDD